MKNEKSLDKRFKVVKEVSSITHMHFRSVFSCFIYINFAIALMHSTDKANAYESMQAAAHDFLADKDFDAGEVRRFDRVLRQNIVMLQEKEIKSSGYVVDTLEASLWCFMTSKDYREAVLKAVNLGGDMDTTGMVTGGLAGLYYGLHDIPSYWIQGLARKDDILRLSTRFEIKYGE